MHLCDSSENSSASSMPIFGVLAPPVRSTHSVLHDAEQLGWASSVSDLAGLVGGIDALEGLDDVPLRDDPFDWTLVADKDRSVVAELLALIDDRVEHAFGIEYQIVTHRLLERIATHDPSSLRRGSVMRTAAALTWLALRGNGELSGRRWPSATGIWAMFRVSSCADRGRVLFSSTGMTPRQCRDYSPFRSWSDVWLCDPLLLHSDSRMSVMEQRDATIRAIESDATGREEAHPIKRLADGNLSISARSVTPRWAIRSRNASGRALVLTTFGESEDDPEVLALSISDARHLIALLERALDSTTPVLVS
jgi:hypothetical protein